MQKNSISTWRTMMEKMSHMVTWIVIIKIAAIKDHNLKSVVNIILRRTITLKTFRNFRKEYAKEVLQVVEKAPKRARRQIAFLFDDSDLDRVKFFQNKSLVILLTIDNYSVNRALVDSGIQIIISLHIAFLKMGHNAAN